MTGAARMLPLRRLLLSAALLSAVFLAPAASMAAEFRVTPIRVDFDRTVKTSVVTVLSEGHEKLNLQMRAYEWTQDADGKDVYTETSDLIYFPRIMTLDTNEAKTLRAGVKSAASAREKTYRLFIEEIPSPKKTPGMHVNVSIRFGLPIFVKPLKEEPKALVEKVSVSGGSVRAVVRNTGNVHLKISSVAVTGRNAAGEEAFVQQINGWYLLNGAVRAYTAAMPEGACPGVARVEVEVVTDRGSYSGSSAVDASSCAR